MNMRLNEPACVFISALNTSRLQKSPLCCADFLHGDQRLQLILNSVCFFKVDPFFTGRMLYALFFFKTKKNVQMISFIQEI